MRNESIRYLIVPGWQGSPEDHWQSHWQNSLPNSVRVEQADWLTPRREDWVAALAEATVMLVRRSTNATTSPFPSTSLKTSKTYKPSSAPNNKPVHFTLPANTYLHSHLPKSHPITPTLSAFGHGMPTVPRTAGGGPCLAASSLPHGPPGVGKQLDLVNGQVSRPLQHRTPLELYLAARYERNSFTLVNGRISHDDKTPMSHTRSARTPTKSETHSLHNDD